MPAAAAPGRGWWIGLALILLLAAHLRVVAVLETRVIEPVRADAADYYHYALNLREHGVYSRIAPPAVPAPDAVRVPGYPLFLLPFVEGPPTVGMLLSIGMVQAALGVLAVWLTALLGLRVVGPATGLAAAALAAISPHLVNASVWMLTEALFAALLLVALVLALGANGRIAGGFRLFAAAVALGAAMLTRSTLDLLPALLCVIALAGLRGAAGRRAATLLVAGVLLVLAPWIARNAIVLGRAGDGTLAFSTLHHGIYPDFMLDDRPETLGFPYRHDADAPKAENGTAELVRELWRRASAQPARYAAWYLLGKPVSLFAWNEVRIGDAFILAVSDTPYFRRREFFATHWTARVLHWPLVALAGLGVALAWSARQPPGRAPDGARLLAVLLIYLVALHVVGAPYPRYSVPFRPQTYVLALFALAWLAARVRGRLRDASHAPAAITA